jgi:hypothetical protein
LAKVESFSTVSAVSIWDWATASHERALDNARAAAVECSRRRLERAEAAQVVAELTAAYGGEAARPTTPAVGHEMSAQAGAR